MKLKLLILTSMAIFGISNSALASDICVISNIGVHTNGETVQPSPEVIQFEEEGFVNLGKFMNMDISYRAGRGFSLSGEMENIKVTTSKQALLATKTHSDASVYSTSIVCGYK